MNFALVVISIKILKTIRLVWYWLYSNNQKKLKTSIISLGLRVILPYKSPKSLNGELIPEDRMRIKRGYSNTHYSLNSAVDSAKLKKKSF